MNILEAIELGNRYILEMSGIAGNPVSASYLKLGKENRKWRLTYDGHLFINTTEGSTLDGGEVFVDVDDSNGSVGPSF